MQMNGKIAVVGATGRVGWHVADLLAADGWEVARLARSVGVDIITGEGLAEALRGATVIIDLASGRSPEQAAATEFWLTATRNLREASERAGIRRIVTISIIGVGHFKTGYYAAKYLHEQATLAGPIPARVLRAAQFHEFVPQMMEWGRQGDITYIPKMPTQLVAARTVAGALVDLATDTNNAADGTTAEIAGPRVERMAEMAQLYADRTGLRTEVQEVDDPGDPEHLYEKGVLLPSAGATLAGPTFAEWLAATLAQGDAAAHLRSRLNSAHARH